MDLQGLVLRGEIDELKKHRPVEEFARYKDKNGSSLLHYAAGCGNESICRFLLSYIDVNVSCAKHGRSALHWAARNGKTDICKMLVNEFDASIDTPARGGVTPLELAVWQVNVDTAKSLVDMGAEVNRMNSWGCNTAHWLGKASDHQSDEVLHMCQWIFEERQVECNRPNSHGQTPLHKAAFSGNFTVAKYLCQTHGVIDDTYDNNGNSGADCAERGKQPFLARWLRRQSSVIHRAVQLLDLKWDSSSCAPPKLHEIRSSYLNFVKRHHPDVVREPTGSEERRWYAIVDAYQILEDYWTDAEDTFDAKMRIKTRNSRLMDYKRLLWHSTWHEVQRKESPNDDLAEFESRLVRMLSAKGFAKKGLNLSQLPREFEKNYHVPLPDPKSFGHRKLVKLLRTLSTRIIVDTDKSTLITTLSVQDR